MREHEYTKFIYIQYREGEFKQTAQKGLTNSGNEHNVEIAMHPNLKSNQINSLASNWICSQRLRPGRVGHFLWLVLLAAFLSVMGAVPIMAVPLQLPAIVEPASQEHHVGKVIFVELVTPDLAVAKQFYSGLFGWTYRDIQTGSTKYTQAFLNGRSVAGLIHKDVPVGEHRQPAWLTFFAVGDVSAAKTVALQNGAKVLFKPHNIPDRGEEAIFADPQGAVLQSSLPVVAILPMILLFLENGYGAHSARVIRTPVLLSIRSYSTTKYSSCQPL